MITADIDGLAFGGEIPAMTAADVICQIKGLPLKERRKVFAYVDADIERREDRADRKAMAEARRDMRPAVPWADAKKRLGLA